MAQTPSQACCNTPPVVASGYQPKGQYTTVDGLKTYTTGPSDASRGILLIFDIFGFWPQTIQGADILSTSDKDKKYQVFMPDFFEGNPADITWFPPDTPEKGEKLGAFFGAQGAPPKSVPRVPKIIEELKGKHPNIKEWALVGFCWGGKVAALNSTPGTPFKATAIAHPAMVDPNDAKDISIPFLMMPSGDEEKKDCDAFVANLKVPHEVEYYNDQIHGWMAARSNLSDKNVVAAYEKAYTHVLSFFHKYL